MDSLFVSHQLDEARGAHSFRDTATETSNLSSLDNTQASPQSPLNDSMASSTSTMSTMITSLSMLHLESIENSNNYDSAQRSSSEYARIMMLNNKGIAYMEQNLAGSAYTCFKRALRAAECWYYQQQQQQESACSPLSSRAASPQNSTARQDSSTSSYSENSELVEQDPMTSCTSLEPSITTSCALHESDDDDNDSDQSTPSSCSVSNPKRSPAHDARPQTWSNRVMQSAMSSLAFLGSSKKRSSTTRKGQSSSIKRPERAASPTTSVSTNSPTSSTTVNHQKVYSSHRSGDHTRQARSLTNTGGDRTTAINSFKHKSEYDEGMDQYPSLLRLEVSLPTNVVIPTICHNLGRVQHNRGNADKALEYYAQTRTILLGTSTISKTTDSEDSSEYKLDALAEHGLVLASLFSTGHIQYMQGDHDSALDTYTQCLTLAENHFGADSLAVAACLNAVGVMHYIMPQGKADDAMRAFLKCLALRSRVCKTSPELGTTWNNIGRLNFQANNYPQAMDAYRRALEIRRMHGDNSVDVAATIFNIGQVLHQLKEHDRALRHYQEFLKLAKRHYGEYHRDICIVTTCIGQILHHKNHLKKAKAAYHHALRVGRIALGTCHPGKENMET